MMRTIAVLLLIVVLIFSGSCGACKACDSFLVESCSKNFSEETALQATAFYSVPLRISSDLKGKNCEKLEEDEYGRILFSTQNSVNSETDRKVTVYVICQTYDEQYVYFYEDICYAYEGESLDELKANNNWNLPLDESKMSRRKVLYSFDNVLKTGMDFEFPKWKQICLKDLNMTDITDHSFLDLDASGHYLFYLKAVNSNGEESIYYTIFNDSYEAKYMKIQDFYSNNSEELRQFKQECNWGYGW